MNIILYGALFNVKLYLYSYSVVLIGYIRFC